MFRWAIVTILTLTIASAAVTQQEPLFTPLKLQYVAPKAFLTSAGLIAAPRFIQNQEIINPQHTSEGYTVVPLTVLTGQSGAQNYLNQGRSNRLPPQNNLLPELQFADKQGPQRILPIISNSQASALLNTAYQPGYVLMAMPPSSYTSVAYYNDEEDNEQDPNQQSDTTQPVFNHRTNSKSKIVPRSNSDTAPASDSSSDFADSKKAKAYTVSYKDNHVNYSY